MKMMEIAFSLEWFTTIPGILISCGVLLLIIALIMFIVGSIKGGKDNDAVPSVLEETKPEEQSPETVTPVVEETVAPVMESTELPTIEPIQAVETSSNEESEIDSVMPSVEVAETTDNSMNDIPTIDIPVIEPMAIEEPVETPIEVPTENVELSTNEVEEPVESFEIPTENITIEEPVENVDVENEHRPIYGGADPLEATQSLPKIDVHHEPYSGGVKEVKIVEPTAEPTFKVEDNTSIETPAESQQDVVKIPDDIEEL